MRNIINLDIHEVRRFLVCKDDEKKINVSIIIMLVTACNA